MALGIILNKKMMLLIVVLLTQTEFAIAALYRTIKLIKERSYADEMAMGVSHNYTDFSDIWRKLRT
jgi:hypothetical protein